MPDLNVALRIRADLRNAVAQIDRLEKELRQTGRAGRQAAQGTRQAAASIERAGRAADRSSRGFTRLQGAVAGISFALLAREAVQAVRSITQTGLAFERLEQRFTFGAGSLRQGAEEFAFVRSEAERLGLAFQPAAQGLSQLQAAVRGTGISLSQTREIFLGVAEAATVLRLSQDQVAGAFRAIEQIASKGTLQAEEIRGQLGERLPGAFQIAARAMGVTTAELNKMLEQGEVLSEDFLPRFGAQLRREFGDAAEEASDSAQASFNRLGNSIERLAESIAKSGLLEFLADAADRITVLTDAIGALDGQLSVIEQLGGDRSVPGGGLTREQAAVARGTARETIDAAAAGDARAQLEIFDARIARIEEVIAEFNRILEDPPPEISVEAVEASIRAQTNALRRIRAVRDPIAQRAEGETELERFRRRIANDATLRGDATPQVNEEEYEKALDAILKATEGHVRARTRLLESDELQAVIRARRAREENQRLLDDALEHANGNLEAEERARRLHEANELQITQRFQDEIAEIRRKAREKEEREAEREARERERLTRRQRRAVRGVEEAIADADLDLSEATDTERAIAEITRWRDTHLRALEEVGLGSSIFADRVRASADRQIDAYREQATVLGSLRRAARDYAREAGDAADEAAGAFNAAVRGMEDALVSFVQTGKLSFSDLANSIIADIARIVVRQQILGPLVGAFGGGSLFGGLFHAGGQVGHGTRSRSVDPRAFAFAPRYHEGGVAGLRPDEVPAILQRGETVIPRGAGVMAGLPPITVNFENRGTPQREVESHVRMDPYGVVVDIVVDNLENGGPIRDAVRRTQGAGL